MRRAFILLFRGINVGGNKIVKMEILRRVLVQAGFADVLTYIQSGNAVFSANGDEAEISAVIEKVFPPAFGFSSRPTVRSLEAWREIIASNPFPEGAASGNREHAVLLDGVPEPAAIEALRALASTEQLALGERVLYLYTPDGFGTSKVSMALEKLLRVPWTARNWNTMLKLESMAAGLKLD